MHAFALGRSSENPKMVAAALGAICLVACVFLVYVLVQFRREASRVRGRRGKPPVNL